MIGNPEDAAMRGDLAGCASAGGGGCVAGNVCLRRLKKNIKATFDALYRLNQSIYCLTNIISVAGQLVMPTVEEIKSAISALSKEDYIHLREWLSEKDWEQWDKEIEGDSASGKLDFLMEEAAAEKNRGRLGKL